MSVISIHAPTNASITEEKQKAPPEMSPNALDGYKIAASKEGAVRRSPLPVNPNAVGRVGWWVFRCGTPISV